MHNNAAIKFIESNNWHFYGIEKNHYRYRDNLYDSKLYYYILDMNWCNTKDISNNEENKGGIEEASTGQRGCWESIFGGYFSGNSSNNKNDIINNKDISSNSEIKSNERNEA